MKILAIETSCDETAIAYVEARGNESSADFSILGNSLLSQIDIHKEYGGVYPAVAKREHAKNLVAVLDTALASDAPGSTDVDANTIEEVHALLAREIGLADALIAYLETHGKPELDAIAVTHGPGLAPALWVGVNFAKALALAWNVPIVGVNHMDGHLLSALATRSSEFLLSVQEVKLPVLALLISGGHTELVLMKAWGEYQLIGRTRDDAVGEAYDKVARMLGLPYPGGPEVSKLAEAARDENLVDVLSLPRPMLDSGNHDFSFAGLKTAVLYLLKGAPETNPKHVAYAFEEAVGDVLSKKVSDAIDDTNAATLAIGGGVSANTHIRRVFAKLIEEQYPDVTLSIPHTSLTGDNAVMIAIAGFYRTLRKEYADPETLVADGNLSLA